MQITSTPITSCITTMSRVNRHRAKQKNASIAGSINGRRGAHARGRQRTGRSAQFQYSCGDYLEPFWFLDFIPLWFLAMD
jgi:hypothetical protein